jgi:hypothetical protein
VAKKQITETQGEKTLIRTEVHDSQDTRRGLIESGPDRKVVFTSEKDITKRSPILSQSETDLDF